MKETIVKYCWLDLSDGAFSDSWTQEEMDSYGGSEKLLQGGAADIKVHNTKLIQFTCVNDTDFEFTNHMKLR